MKKIISITLIAMLCGAGLSAQAQDTMKKDGMHMKDGMPMASGKSMAKGMDMKMMDTNSDGMITKEEFMKHHESMFDKMKKDSNGMVNMKDMHTMMNCMMKK